ncbi:uncharacterized protein TRUGW13939_10404 [Talaromyces rugulosus]|uniref:Major facilitator superfamily (MFS) profile domain-containing protein n=1 Tax=Talaromyces rugulosus TaxID=121627 RepID=A0A7H8RCK1_TALRU|nr:uncharacterized protein TRUGW13939_10404 [Talaromyces rugulosus]QKX63235.1 hypothetical protein TRUGW13939_10404 [Talaromyces rugulosus]
MSPIGSGLLTTFTTDANLSKLICFQALLGFGIGIGIQAPQVAAQTTLSSEDIPIGISAVMFAHGIGPAVFVSAAQSIFISRLKVYLADFSTQANATLLGDSGLNNMISHVEADKLQGVLKACDKAVTEAFFLPVTLTILGMAGAASIRWHLVKQRYT